MVLRIGHRGACGYAPENTLLSVQKALELGCDHIEIDVHRCATGEIVVIHDKKVDRTTNGKGSVAHYSLDELREFHIGDDQKIPLLQEVIELTYGKAVLNIELKGKNTAQGTAHILRELNLDNFLVSSFDVNKLTRMQELLPLIRCGYIHTVPRVTSFNFDKYTQFYSLHPSSRANSLYAYRAHKRGLKVYAWTVNDQPTIDRLILDGVDGIISDYPDRIPK